jgi:hypothetical protein
MVFGPVLEAFGLPLTVSRALHGSGSMRGCLAGSLLSGDVFLCGLLVCSWCILGGEVVNA